MPFCKPSRAFLLTLALAGAGISTPLPAQSGAADPATLLAVAPRDRVLRPVEDAQRVALSGNTPPPQLLVHETGEVPGDRRLERMMLQLKPDAAQQRALDALLEAQQNPASPLYHHWLTPQSYASHFGVSEGDIEQVRGWLERYGFTVEPVPANHRTLIFSGTAAQVESAFQTRMRSYTFHGKRHIANASDPMIPGALAEVIGGVVSLHDFFSQPPHRSLKISRQLSPEYSSGSAHYLTPADFATIYDLTTLYHQAYDGTGETIAIVGRADISLSDVRAFRSQFGLPAKDPVVIQAGGDPGSASAGDVGESMLDVEWSGAVASGATIDFVPAASTGASDGVSLSAQYIVNHNLAPIMSISYGLCEASLGAGGNSFYNALGQQAAAQGITVLVSSGDNGAAGCDGASETEATQGRAVNGLCSSPYTTCVGGTEFQDTANPGRYWNSGNAGNGGSALGYIPEAAWNESGSDGLWSTGGGASSVYPKPSWQSGRGVPADGRRDVPDVALTAAGHDGYLVYMGGALYAFGGTSAAAPSFAGLLAIVAQKTAARLGDANPELYKLAALPASPSGTVFHDVVSGNNSVPGVTGYNAASGYDQTTGLGSVDADMLVTAWGTTGGGGISSPAFTLTLAKSSLTLAKGGSARITVTTAVSGGLNAPISLSLGTLPAGVSANFTPGAIAAPGGGTSTLTITAGTLAPAGTATLTVTAKGGGLTRTASLAETIPGLTLTATAGTTTLTRGGTMTISVNTTAVGFSAPLVLAVNGLPTGVTAKFTPANLAAPGSAHGTLVLTAAKLARLGAAKIDVTATGGGLSASGNVAFTLTGTNSGSGPARRVPKL